MKNKLVLLTISTLLCFNLFQFSKSAHACMTFAPMNLSDVFLADAVVIGKITKYKIVKNIKIREQLNSFSKNNSAPKILRNKSSYLSDYARFEIIIDEVLHGESSKKMIVTWNNSTFGEPEELPSGKYLIALRFTKSPRPPLRGPSATIFPNPEPELMTVLQAPCASPFIFKKSSEWTHKIRLILNGEEKGKNKEILRLPDKHSILND